MVPQANASVAQSEMRHAALCSIVLPISENIADTSKSSNERPMPLSIHLSAQAVDVDIHDIGVRLDSHTPYLVENHGSSHDAAGVSAKILQKHKLLRSQIQYLSASRSLPP